jgi:hypothetical protein
VRGARELCVLNAARERRADRDRVPAGASVKLPFNGDVGLLDPTATIDDLRHIYRRKLLALDRRAEDPRPHFWIRASTLERIRAIENSVDRQNGERKAKKT